MKHFNNFKTNNADLSLRLTELIENRQCSDAAVLCHSIKGLSGMLGLTALYKHIIALEDILKKRIPLMKIHRQICLKYLSFSLQ